MMDEMPYEDMKIFLQPYLVYFYRDYGAYVKLIEQHIDYLAINSRVMPTTFLNSIFLSWYWERYGKTKFVNAFSVRQIVPDGLLKLARDEQEGLNDG